jgi:hypothetical protein
MTRKPETRVSSAVSKKRENIFNQAARNVVRIVKLCNLIDSVSDKHVCLRHAHKCKNRMFISLVYDWGCARVCVLLNATLHTLWNTSPLSNISLCPLNVVYSTCVFFFNMNANYVDPPVQFLPLIYTDLIVYNPPRLCCQHVELYESGDTAAAKWGRPERGINMFTIRVHTLPSTVVPRVNVRRRDCVDSDPCSHSTEPTRRKLLLSPTSDAFL